MGVLACDRNGCENIMCDRHSHTYGYICDECFDEMVESGLDIGEFMSTPKAESFVHKSYEDEFQLR